MAILIEGISVVVRCRAIVRGYAGGQSAFAADVPNDTLRADGELAAVTFLTPADVKAYVERIEGKGLRYLRNGAPEDIVVVDQKSGIRGSCDWVRLGVTEWNDRQGQTVTVCQLNPTVVDRIVAPKGWAYETSLTARGRHVDGDAIPSSLRPIGTRNGVDILIDEATGERFEVRRV